MSALLALLCLAHAAEPADPVEAEPASKVAPIPGLSPPSHRVEPAADGTLVIEAPPEEPPERAIVCDELTALFGPEPVPRQTVYPGAPVPVEELPSAFAEAADEAPAE